MSEKAIMSSREVILHPIIDGQIHAIQEPPPHTSAGECYDCPEPASIVVEEQNGSKWLWCGQCALGG